jgi:two-component system, LytTR family, response regulator
MMRALVVDDEAPARAKLRRWLAAHTDIEIAGEAADGLSAAQAIATLTPDVVFLDIRMPHLSGLELAAQLQPNSAPLIVFVTALGDHALQAFDLDAVDYLLKPFDEERLLRTLERVRARLRDPALRTAAIAIARAQAGSSERMLVPEGEQLRIIQSRSILWLEADRNYLDLHTRERTYRLRRTLQDLLAQLAGLPFVRVHKSTAVNLTEIVMLHPLFKGDYEVELRNGARVRMSRRYRDEVFSKIS